MRKLTLMLVSVLVLALAIPAQAGVRNTKATICHVFGKYCNQALRVSSCETGGTFDLNARNGQYLGLFQMGRYARQRYGHGYTAWRQAIAAYKYFADTGYDWSPWSCKPW